MIDQPLGPDDPIVPSDDLPPVDRPYPSLRGEEGTTYPPPQGFVDPFTGLIREAQPGEYDPFPGFTERSRQNLLKPVRIVPRPPADVWFDPVGPAMEWVADTFGTGNFSEERQAWEDQHSDP